ncbi:YdcF family protein [Nitrospinaceae bacterium]|nr:YdcF family protein [Nitrospinaceae bacterium]
MKKSFLMKIFMVFGVILIMGIIFLEPLLRSVSRVLVHEDPLVKADAIVVLAGGNGNRIEAAARLYREGFGEKLLFSGFRVYPETYSSSLMKKYALKLGVPEVNIITYNPDVEVSTRGESLANLELLKMNRMKKFIIVTSAYHTRRSNLIYKRAVSLLEYDVGFLVYPAPDPYVPINSWWKIRTGQKAIFFEYAKSIAYYFNL